MTYEIHIEKRPPGNWIGDERLAELARDGWVLQTAIQARDFGANEPEAGFVRYVLYKAKE